MDPNSVQLIAGLVDERVAAIRRVQPKDRGKGRSLVVLVEAMLRGVEHEKARLLADIESADPDEAEVLGRKLLRLLTQARTFSLLVPFLADVGRADLPAGLVQAIDLIIESLLPEGADPVIHLDEHHMYSTLDTLAMTSGLRQALDVGEDPDPAPTVFLLPGTDPHNALLLPILAHEVGHVAAEQASLVSEVLGQADVAALNALLDECLTAAGENDATPWQIALFGWVEELLCDALAAVLTGPSFVFAAAVFLPAPDPGSLGTHPYPADRIRLTFGHLDHMGWGDFLDEGAPAVCAWLREIDSPIDQTSPKERFLRGGVEILEPAIRAVALGHVGDPLLPGDFRAIDSFLRELIEAGIPPAEIGGDPVPPWAAVLAAWLHVIQAHGGGPAALVRAIRDGNFNATVLKAIEMSRVLSLWREQ